MGLPGSTTDLLRFLITSLDDDLEAGLAPVEPPVLLRLDGAEVACAVDGIDLKAKHFEGHPAELLFGFTAPPEWFGVGVLTGGWAHSPDRTRHRVRVTSFLCRDGAELAAARSLDDGELQFLEGRSEGVMADTLRRVLGMATHPPEVSAVEDLFARCWLEAIIAATKRGRRAAKLGWQKAAALHPGLTLLDDPFSWERVRQRAAGEGDEAAAWMDEGMFARTMVNSRPPVEVLLPRAERRLTADARRRVESMLREWGLLGTADAA